MAKTLWSFGHSECNRVNMMGKALSGKLSCTQTSPVLQIFATVLAKNLEIGTSKIITNYTKMEQTSFTM